MVYAVSPEGIGPDALKGFFEGWPNPPSRETHLMLPENSDHVVLAVDSENGEVAGFVTAVSDGILSAYVSYLEVRPDYRSRGIGSGLMRRMLEKLDGPYVVDLVCDLGLVPFYERFGMQERVATTLRDHDRQAGRWPG